jgi:hypothetical protein
MFTDVLDFKRKDNRLLGQCPQSRIIGKFTETFVSRSLQGWMSIQLVPNFLQNDCAKNAKREGG